MMLKTPSEGRWNDLHK